MKRRSTFRRQWSWPIVLALVTMIGLLSALLGESGIFWWLSWALLALPLVTACKFVFWPSAARSPGRTQSR